MASHRHDRRMIIASPRKCVAHSTLRKVLDKHLPGNQQFHVRRQRTEPKTRTIYLNIWGLRQDAFDRLVDALRLAYQDLKAMVWATGKRRIRITFPAWALQPQPVWA